MSARGLVVDDNSLVREALRFMPTQLELQAVYLHQREDAPAPKDVYGDPWLVQTSQSGLLDGRLARRPEIVNSDAR